MGARNDSELIKVDSPHSSSHTMGASRASSTPSSQKAAGLNRIAEAKSSRRCPKKCQQNCTNPSHTSGRSSR